MQAQSITQELQKVMRSFGRACRGQGHVYVKLVRTTEKQLLEIGQGVVPLALTVQVHLHAGRHLATAHKARLERTFQSAFVAHHQIEKQSQRLTNGKALPHAKIVNAYDTTIAPIKKGKSNCPTQFGKKPGIIAEMASGFIFAFHVPEGNPDDASYVIPLVDSVNYALAQHDFLDHTSQPVIRSVAGDLGLHDPKVRTALHSRGILTVGIPRGIEPIPQVPSPEQIREALESVGSTGICHETQVQIAYACGYSRPFVESLIGNLICRGGTRITYKGHRGALIQIGMAIMANNAATLMRIRQNRLTKRAQTFRRLFRLKPPNPNNGNDLIN